MFSIFQQEIMEKFEFFPIKCRTQRADDIFQKYSDKFDSLDCGAQRTADNTASLGRPLKMKASMHVYFAGS